MARRRLLVCAALLACVALPVSADRIGVTTFGGWPAIGFSAALFLLAGRTWLYPCLAVQTALLTLGLTVTYDLNPFLALPASLTVTLPALLTVSMLEWGWSRPQTRLDLIDSDRYHLVTALSALLCGIMSGVVVLAYNDVRSALIATLMSFLAALSAQLVVLPLVFGDSRARPVAGAVELMFLRLALLGFTAATLSSASSGVLFFVVFTVLAWAARRATPREAHLQLFLVCGAAHTVTLLGRGPLAEPPSWISPELAPLVFYLFAISACYLVVPITLGTEEMVSMTRHAQRAARTVEQLFDSAVGTVLIAVDEQGIVTHFNSGAQQALGYEAGDMVGSEPTMLWTAAELNRQARHFDTVPDAGQVVRANARTGERREWRLTRSDGRPCTLSLSISTVHDSEGRAVGMIASGEDVSQRIRREQALAAALERELASVRAMQSADQVKDDLVSTVSHELRTPITSIAGYAELLGDGVLGPLTEKQGEALDRIDRNTTRLRVLVEDLLTMSRSETGLLELECQELDLRTVAREAFETLRETNRARQLDLELHLPELPVPAVADRVAMGRVLENLLTNATKFTPDGGRVSLRVCRADDECSIVVTDTGLGIPEGDLPHVFERFFRSSVAAERAVQGSGLGLSIVHAIITQHQGTVEVTSTSGAGTTFTVRLPSLGPVGDATVAGAAPRVRQSA